MDGDAAVGELLRSDDGDGLSVERTAGSAVPDAHLAIVAEGAEVEFGCGYPGGEREGWMVVGG